MKQLVFVRHSVADEPKDALDDFSRNLTEKGIERTHRVLANIPKALVEQAIFITSPAHRCIQTAQLFAKHFQITEDRIKEEPFLYSCFREHSFYYFLEELVADENNVWIFGHNPMLSNLTEQLLHKKFYSLPKCAVVVFNSKASDWLSVSHENTEMSLFVNPKEL